MSETGVQEGWERQASLAKLEAHVMTIMLRSQDFKSGQREEDEHQKYKA